MPISFEQPGPYNAGVSEAYGALEQENKNRDFWLRAQSALGNSGGGHGGGGGGNAAYNEPLNGGGGGRGGGADPYDMATLHAQLQDQLSQNALTRNEQMRLDRLQNARADIMGDENLSDDEKADAMTLVNTGINPLQMRAQAAQQQQQQLQTSMMLNAQAQQTARQQRDDTFHAQTFEQRIATVQEPLTGRMISMYIDREGNPHPIPGGQGSPEAIDAAQVNESRRTRNAPAAIDHAHLMRDAVAEVNHMYPTGAPRPEEEWNRRVMAAYQRNLQTIESARQPTPNIPQQSEPYDVQRWGQPGEQGGTSYGRRTIQAPGVTEQQFGQAQRRIEQQVDAEIRGGALPRLNEEQRQAQIDQRVRQRFGMTEPRPFHPNSPNLTPQQQTMVRDLDEMRDQINEHYTGERQHELLAARMRLRTLTEQYGDIQAMPPHQRREVQQIQARLTAALRPFETPTPQPTPPANPQLRNPNNPPDLFRVGRY